MSRAAAQVHRQARHQLSSSDRHPPSAFNQSLLLHDTRQPAPAMLTTKPVRRTSLPPSLDTVRELASPDRRVVEPPMELEPAQQIRARRFSFRALFRSRGKAAKQRRPDETAAEDMLHEVTEEAAEPHSLEWLVYRFQSSSRSSTSLGGTTASEHTAVDPTFAPTEGAFQPYQYQKYSLAWQQGQHRKKSRVQPNTGGSVSLTDLITPQRLGRNSSTRSLPLTQPAPARGRPRSLNSVQHSRSRHESAVTLDITRNRPASIRSVRFAEGDGSEVVIPRSSSLLHSNFAIDDPPPTPRSILRFSSGMPSPSLVPEVTVEDTAAGSDESPPSLELEPGWSSDGRPSVESMRRPSMARSIESTLSLPDMNVAPRRRRSSSQSSATRPKLPRPEISVTTSSPSQAPAKASKSSPLGSSTSLLPDQASVIVSSPTSSLASLPPAPPSYQKLSRKVSPGSTISIASSSADRHTSPPSSWRIRNASTTTLLSPLQGLSLPSVSAPSSWGPIKRIRRGSTTSIDSKKPLGVKLASIEKGVHSSKFIRPPKEKPDPKTWGPRPVRGTYDFARGPGEAKRFEVKEGQKRGASVEEDELPPRPTSARSMYVYDWTRDVTESVPWQCDNASTYSLPVFSSPWASDEPSPTDTVVDLPLDKELPPLPTNIDGSETERSASPALSDCSLHRNLSLPKPTLPEVPEYITKHERRLAKMAERAERRLSVQVAVHSRERASRSSAKGKGSTRRTLSAPPISDAPSDAATIHSDRPEFDSRHRTHSHQALSPFEASPPPSSWSSNASNFV